MDINWNTVATYSVGLIIGTTASAIIIAGIGQFMSSMAENESSAIQEIGSELILR